MLQHLPFSAAVCIIVTILVPVYGGGGTGEPQGHPGNGTNVILSMNITGGDNFTLKKLTVNGSVHMLSLGEPAGNASKGTPFVNVSVGGISTLTESTLGNGSVHMASTRLSGSYDPQDEVACKVMEIPGLQWQYPGAYICSPLDQPGKFPLLVFAHGDELFPGRYETFMRKVSSFGFVVAAYRSCLHLLSCDMGKLSFLEVLKTIQHFADNPHVAPVDMNKGVTVVGHGKGGLAVLMAAAVKNSPTYLRATKYAKELYWGLRQAASKISAAISIYGTPADSDHHVPDIENFRFAISEVATFIVTGSEDVGFGQRGAAWKSFETIAASRRAFLNIAGGHSKQIFDDQALGSYVALWGRAFALGDVAAKDIVYGEAPESMKWYFMRNVLTPAKSYDSNVGEHGAGLVLCGAKLVELDKMTVSQPAAPPSEIQNSNGQDSCCNSCGKNGKAFCSPNSRNCYYVKDKPIYETCDNADGTTCSVLLR